MTILLYDLVGSDPTRPFSPHCWKAAMSLAHKGLAYESVATPFTKVPAVEDGRSRTVPVIRDGATVVADSFEIALYLDRAYPDRPTLFGGEGGQIVSRFVEKWSQLTIHPYIAAAVLPDIHACLAAEDQAYFRESRERRYGMRLEDMSVGREERRPAFLATLEPLRTLLSQQPWIGGASPLFADYIVFGAFQWARVVSRFELLPAADPVAAWFERCLDLHGGVGRRVPAAA